MRKIPRVRERTASPAEIADETERCRRAKEASRVLAPKPATEGEGNLCACLVLFARWRKCYVCARPVLYVDARCRTDADVECPTCQAIREELAKRLRPSLPALTALHLRSLFSTSANDNHEARA